MAGYPTASISACAESKKTFCVSVEGNHGCGKTTCLKYFEKYPNIKTFPMSDHLWRKSSGINLLELMYRDVEHWAFAPRSSDYLKLLKLQDSLPPDPEITVNMFERLILTHFQTMDAVNKNTFQTDPMYEDMRDLFKYVKADLEHKLDLIVYLKTTPEVVMERVMKCGTVEKPEVFLNYLKTVHSCHEERFKPGEFKIPVLTIEADQSIDCVEEDLKKNVLHYFGCF